MDDYSVEGSARCPHCGISVQFTKGGTEDLQVGPYWTDYSLRWVDCPHCHGIVITLIHHPKGESSRETLIYPLNSKRAPVSPEVPPAIKADYDEAALILPLSSKGSAAISRRCLETVLVSAGRATPEKKLSQQIDEVGSQLPGYLVKMLDQVRTIGNFAAHPDKDATTAAIIDVEPGEAEWNLDVLDELFDFYYVKPAAIMRTTDQLNEKLKAAGKRTI
ncbi:DUF4145 domain-containing protein [Candidatus Cryosericum septentrionale]|uniref:DUF4145 domain-containing protein n=1 Tax=Candidatus Cryosericum septentrionale TaxID=2290913 RepID=A0A398DR01_9BACT|nr:DUF4145 domain-containing protein [Candidatus Cryosericum septentrionale]RIE17685.1 DUF4145 domain-containing protein [Candidatus Cryosericum septentrionale]